MKKFLTAAILIFVTVIYSQHYGTWLSDPPQAQLSAEGKDDQLGYGRVFVPAMSFSEWEPLYKIYKSGEGVAADEAVPGTSVFLRPGRYTLLFGSSQDPLDIIQKHFTVYEHQTTQIEPDWSGLIVSVINENMEYVRFGYELMHLETGISAGTRYSREESSFNEMNYTWILPAGKYKLVKQGEPFNTITNFTTFELKKGELTEMTVVVNDLQRMTGAGELGLLENFDRSSKEWFNKLSLKGSVSLYSDNESGEGENSTDIISQAKIDNRLIYDSSPYYLNFRQSLNEEFSKLEDTEGLRLSLDQFLLNNTGIYYFTKIFGIYGELSLETKIFPEYRYDIPETAVVEVTSNDGQTVTHTGISRYKMSDPFSPLNTAENIGLNFTFIKSSNSNLYVRTGFGFKQDIRENVYINTGSTDSLYTFNEQENLFSKGVIITAGSDFNLPGNITYISTADFFYNLDEEGYYNIIWENDLIFKVFRYVSIDYNFDLSYDHIPDSDSNYWRYYHKLALEFSYYINR